MNGQNYMYNRIVKEPASLMKRLARKALKSNWLMVGLACFLFLLLTTGVTQVLSLVLGSKLGLASSLYSIMVSGAFEFGIIHFMIRFFRTGKTEIEDI
ncbi:MAG: hypothetical protein ACI4LM_03905, partial [Anaerovoracaceae bacterium]